MPKRTEIQRVNRLFFCLIRIIRHYSTISTVDECHTFTISPKGDGAPPLTVGNFAMSPLPEIFILKFFIFQIWLSCYRVSH